jgi:hypothetical protein
MLSGFDGAAAQQQPLIAPILTQSPAAAPVATGRPPGGLWPDGIGMTNKPTVDENDGACPPCGGCCTTPYWYATFAAGVKSKRQLSNQSTFEAKCDGGWEVADADVFGEHLALETEIPCCACENHVHGRFLSGAPFGKATLYYPCACEDTIMAEAFDATGRSRFTRVEHPCCPHMGKLSHTGEGCEVNWPIYGPREQFVPGGTAQTPLTYLTYRTNIGNPYPCCAPQWLGYKQWPANATDNDKRLLLLLAHARWWRKEKQEKNGGGS